MSCIKAEYINKITNNKNKVSMIFLLGERNVYCVIFLQPNLNIVKHWQTSQKIEFEREAVYIP